MRVNPQSCRGEGGVEWPGGPLRSPAVPQKDLEPYRGQKVMREEQQ